MRGALPITVPGLVAAWFHLHRMLGRLPVAEVLAPAIALAADGFPVGGRWERAARLHRDLIRMDPCLAALFLRGRKSGSGEGSGRGAEPVRDEEPIRAGSWVRQPDLAETLKGLARHGAAHLYSGELGARIVADLRARGGILSAEDLRAHETQERDPLSLELARIAAAAGPCVVLEQPPVSQGGIVLDILRWLAATDGEREEDRDGSRPKTWHKGASGVPEGLAREVLRGAAREKAQETPRGAAHWTAPGVVSREAALGAAREAAREMHMQILAYREARERRDGLYFDPRFAGDSTGGGAKHSSDDAERIARDTKPRTRDTTSLCAVDPDGNVVTWIQSIFQPFGAGFIVPGTGILLNDRMTGFSLDPASPNRLEPGKRTIHTLNTWMVLRGGRPWILGGTPGGERQVQTNAQILRWRLAHGRALAEAIEAPRWGIDEKGRVEVEARLPREVRRRLEALGHDIVRVGPWNGSGFVQAIERLDEGGWLACTDPRGEGLAGGF